jgi:hypothetical protein
MIKIKIQNKKTKESYFYRRWGYMGYPYDFVQFVKSAFPNNKRLRKALEHGDVRVGILLKEETVLKLSNRELREILLNNRTAEVVAALDQTIEAEEFLKQWENMMGQKA